ncbi:MAG: signal peptide peptidase SppA [Nitrospinae bacterium]|nr:signal peptide peptidase SppA [Nitrospinota bacterium]
MQISPVPHKKRLKGATLFLLGVLALLAISGGIASLLPEDALVSRRKIGLVEVKGMIADSSGIVEQLSKFRRDKNIQGIILRIDSPGGAVAPAQEIYGEVLRVRESKKKIFASLGSLAASGGYYIASPADQIIANPGTLTGSIGVIMTFANLESLIDKIGVKPEVVKSGKYKDTGSPARPLSSEERQLLQGVVDDVYRQFVAAVASGRKMDAEEVRKLADGRIYTGRQAFDLKLVDRLGGLEDAIQLLGEAVGIEGRPRVVQEKPRPDFWEWLLQSSLPQGLIQSITPSNFPSLQYLWTGG